MSTPNYFATLSAINVNEHVEKKGGFSYLSWPFAVAQLRLADPAATWEVKRFNGLPFLLTEAGVFVEVAVTIQGVTLSQVHPVLDGRNRPLIAPTSFDINTSIQRCLVKAIALHGLGLYIYAGEDLPSTSTEAANDESPPAGEVPTKPTEPTRPTQIRRPAEAVITKAQVAQIHRLVVETGTNLQRMLDFFGYESMQDIKLSDFARIVRSLEARRAA